MYDSLNRSLVAALAERCPAARRLPEEFNRPFYRTVEGARL